MKLGVDIYTIRSQGWDAFQILDYCAVIGLDLGLPRFRLLNLGCRFSSFGLHIGRPEESDEVHIHPCAAHDGIGLAARAELGAVDAAAVREAKLRRPARA